MDNYVISSKLFMSTCSKRKHLNICKHSVAVQAVFQEVKVGDCVFKHKTHCSFSSRNDSNKATCPFFIFFNEEMFSLLLNYLYIFEWSIGPLQLTNMNKITYRQAAIDSSISGEFKKCRPPKNLQGISNLHTNLQ